MATIRLVLPGQPRGKALKVSRNRGFYGIRPTDRSQTEMDQFRLIARRAMAGQPPLDGPVELEMCAYMTVPVSWSRKEREAALAGDIRPTGKPDGSNIQKLIEDAILNVVIVDDAQIVRWTGWKMYSNEPRVVVKISDAP